LYFVRSRALDSSREPTRDQPMNDFSQLPVSASDSRLSRPEAAPPNLVSPALQARRLKLRRIVAWVVGGATLLMCAGLVRAAISSHSEAAPDVAPSPAVQALAAAPTPSAAPAAPDPSAAGLPPPPAASAAVAAAKPAHKASGAHASKTKHSTTSKTAIARH
jgi:hypothetical protein